MVTHSPTAMRKVAWTLAALVLSVLLNIDPATASCSVTDDPVRLEVCDDDNGNATPDRVYIGTPVGSVRFDEPTCADCASPSTLKVSLGAAGQGVSATVYCYTIAGQANARCVDADADAGSPLAGAWAKTSTGPGPNTWACTKLHTHWVVLLVRCVQVPHPVPVPW